MKKITIILFTILGLFIFAACTSPQTPTAETSDTAMTEAMDDSQDTMTEDTMSDDEMMSEDDAMMSEDDAMMSEDDAMMAEDSEMMDDTAHDAMAEGDAMMSDDTMEEMAGIAAWQDIELTDARTGETFTLASFSGKTVFVEPMATWCTNCRQQLGNVREARTQLGDDVVFIGLSLETNLSDADLAQYQADQGFDWTFAVMTPEMLQGLADTFGRSITSAPSTPHFVIRPDGSYTDLVTGIDSPDEIMQQIQAAMS